jgi:hypothetical protein
VPNDQRIFKHKASPDYWHFYRQLPFEIQKIADKCFLYLKENPRHPSLQFKKVGKVWSVRVGLQHRALAVEISEGYLWIWIGRHDEYDQILK